MVGAGEQTISLDKNDVPTSPVGKIQIELEAPGGSTARNLRLEACVEYTGVYIN